VALDRVDRKPEAGRDLTVGFAAGNEPKDLDLASRQAANRRRRGVTWCWPGTPGDHRDDLVDDVVPILEEQRC
jgi:hypothetical protein